jgi:small neutral amino acid transporter SnatA (MarC family)
MSPNFILGVALLILAVMQTMKQSYFMYKATKHWQPNKYMKLLVRDGIVYFLVCVFLLLFPHSRDPTEN